MMKFLMLVMFVISCGPSIIKSGSKSSSSRLKEAMNDYNNPVFMTGADSDLKFILDDLPDSGYAKNPIWTGSWYPYSAGGTSAATYKYSQAVGKWEAYNWEQGQVKKYQYSSWSGHCNGLAAAGIMTKEPIRNVSYNGVNFSVDDLKALVVESWQGGGYIIGKRCYNGKVKRDSTGRLTDDACRDLNPGAFHVIVANFLGRFGKSVVVDSESMEAVWNYPVVNFGIIESIDLSKSEANSFLKIGGVEYTYNIDAVYFKKIKMELNLTSGRHLYEYILELDDVGEILGGEWIGDSKTYHPDFIWREEKPDTENPYLDVGIINEIVLRSL
jgi:hypothetical protein